MLIIFIHRVLNNSKITSTPSSPCTGIEIKLNAMYFTIFAASIIGGNMYLYIWCKYFTNTCLAGTKWNLLSIHTQTHRCYLFDVAVIYAQNLYRISSWSLLGKIWDFSNAKKDIEISFPEGVYVDSSTYLRDTYVWGDFTHAPGTW